jgi:hypothetical protein
MAGAIVIIVLMVLVLPVAIFIGGLVWSALMGATLKADAETRYDGSEELVKKLW